MRTPRFTAWIISLALLGSGLATAQEKETSPKTLQDIKAERAKRLRGWVVNLRAEVEMLQLDYDLARSDLVDDLKTMKSLDLFGGLMGLSAAINRAGTPVVDVGELQGTSSRVSPTAAPVDDDAYPVPLGRNGRQRASVATTPPVDHPAEEKAEKDRAAETAKYIAEKKKDLARLARALAETRLELEDAEARYRETDLSDRPFPAPRAEPAKLVEAKPGGDAVVGCMPSADDGRVSIVDPTPGKTSDGCVNPPTRAEVWKKLSQRPGGEALKMFGVTVEKVGEKVDARKVYPLAGPCQLIHCHYKATVAFFKPGNLNPTSEVVYLDKDYLRRCPTAEDALPETKATSAEVDPPSFRLAGAEVAAMQPFPTTPAATEARMAAIEAKLDKILKALESK